MQGKTCGLGSLIEVGFLGIRRICEKDDFFWLIFVL
jgi:hypothetical protein